MLLRHLWHQPAPVVVVELERPRRVGAGEDVDEDVELTLLDELLVDGHRPVGDHALELVVRLRRVPGVDLVNNRQPLVSDPAVEAAVRDLPLVRERRVPLPHQGCQDGLAQRSLPHPRVSETSRTP